MFELIEKKSNFLSDKALKILIYFAVIMIIGTTVLTQILLQTGGGVRDEPIDLSDQVPDMFDSLVIFPEGLPGWISSGGVFPPENLIFNIGLKIGGILYIIIGLEVFLRTNSKLIPNSGKEKKYNSISLLCTTLAGLNLFMLTFFPMDKSLIFHLICAFSIFIPVVIWTFTLFYSRKNIDAEMKFRNYNLNSIRKYIAYLCLFSFLLMVFGNHRIAGISVVGSVIGEWGLMFTSQLQVLTFIPILGKNK